MDYIIISSNTDVVELSHLVMMLVTPGRYSREMTM